jgi:SAM-dependent methyltransferase
LKPSIVSRPTAPRLVPLKRCPVCCVQDAHTEPAFVYPLTYLLEDQERMSKARNYLAWQARLILPELGQRVVEVGCGIGNFTTYLLDLEAIIAVDVQPDCVEHLQQRYPSGKNLNAFVCGPDLPSFADLAKFHPDSCVCLNVLEHIEDDRKALQAMASILEPGGVIVLFVPAFQALYGPMDKNLGHYRRYRRESMKELAGAAGLRVRKVHYVNLAGFFGWWLSGRILRRTALADAQVELFDRFIIPLTSRLESLIRAPFGQSLLAVFEKP